MSDDIDESLEASPPAPPPETLMHLEDHFYDILAGATKYTLFTSFFDLQLDKVLHHRGWITADEIIEALGLDPTRGKKWVLLLDDVGLLARWTDEHTAITRYHLGPLTKLMSTPGAPNAYFYREFLRYFRTAIWYDMTSVLRGAPIEHPVRYPPVSWTDTVLLHEWMRDGALTTLAGISRRFDFSSVKRLLDVGGGDATMASQLALRHKDLRITVFNLPQPAAMAEQVIRDAGVADRVKVHVGDFRVDDLPRGFEVVMFSRVMADWSVEVCRRLIAQAHAALDEGGRLLIAEPLRDQNPSLSLAWEHSYLPYDDFGAFVYKPFATYAHLLAEAGFEVIEHRPRDEGTIHGVIVARRRCDGDKVTTATGEAPAV